VRLQPLCARHDLCGCWALPGHMHTIFVKALRFAIVHQVILWVAVSLCTTAAVYTCGGIHIVAGAALVICPCSHAASCLQPGLKVAVLLSE